MSFSRTLDNPKKVELEHLPKKTDIEIHGHTGNWKNSHSLVLPPMNRFGGQIRSKPQSGFNQSTLINNQGQLDFHLNSAGYVEKLFMEMEITVSNNPVTIIPHYLIDRIELFASEGNIISTIYGDNIYAQKIHKTLEQHNREKSVENLSSGYDGVAIAVGSKRIVLHIPTFIDGSHLKLNVIKSKLVARVYFSNLGVTAGLASDISVTLCDIIQHGAQLAPQLESLENKRKGNSALWFRFLNPVRVASQTIAMVASNNYDIRLTSANNLSAYLMFVIRSAPLTTSNINTFQAVDYFELLDSDNTVVGIKTSNEYHKILTQHFQGDIFNYKNIYVVPFALSVESSNNGSQTGLYAFTSNEILRVYMPSTLVGGSYRVDVYSFDYNKLKLENGNLDVSK